MGRSLQLGDDIQTKCLCVPRGSGKQQLCPLANQSIVKPHCFGLHEFICLCTHSLTYSFLQAAVRDDSSQLAGVGRTLVFASTVNAANEVADVLAESGLDTVVYHRKTPVAAQVRSACTAVSMTACHSEAFSSR